VERVALAVAVGVLVLELAVMVAFFFTTKMEINK